jgi:DNA polymerase-4
MPKNIQSSTEYFLLLTTAVLIMFAFCSPILYNYFMSITKEPKDYSVLFLDMNSFFASVEQQVQPSLRGLPIGVAPFTGDSGCIIAASKEAKEHGVSIYRIAEAKKVCPNLRIVESRPALYMIYHKEIRRVIESFTPYFEAMSIDEFAIKLTPQDQSFEKSCDMAMGLKKAIRERVGDYLTCSIGIGSSVFLAKMAGERQKPDGLTVVTLKELEKFYTDLKLTDLTGINWRMEMQLKNFNINSPLCLYRKPMGELVSLLKHWGRLWYFRLRGYEVDDHIVKSKTIGHSHVLAPEFRSKEGALAVLRKLLFKVGYRLRKEGYQAGGICVNINFVDKGNFCQSSKFDFFDDNSSLIKNAFYVLKKCPWQSRPIMLSVSTFNLKKKTSEQIPIFDDTKKAREISMAIDDVNDCFGAETVYPASMFVSKMSAPDRIPFGKPRYEIRT